MLETYRNYFIAGLVLVWSFGVWHISSIVTEHKYQQEKLAVAEEVLEQQRFNTTLKDSISKDLQEYLATIHPQITTINKEIQHEVSTNTVYAECKSTPDIVREYERKLDLQAQ